MSPGPAPLLDPSSGSRLLTWVTEYCALGDHRTGTPVEDRTVGWLAGVLATLGVQARPEPFPFHAFAPTAVELTVEGAPLPADALYCSGVTAPEPARGPLVRLGQGDVRDAIAFADVPFHLNYFAPELVPTLQTATEAGARALVIVTDGPSEERVQVNVEDPGALRSVPTLVVAPKDAAPLQQAADAATATVTLDATMGSGTAHNLWGVVDGPEANTLVAWTPMSGWYRCAAERGPGIAALLALIARHAAVAPERRTARLVFAFTSAHELGYTGGAHWLDAHKAEIRSAKFLHLGATLCCTVPHWTQVFPRFPEPLRSRLVQLVDAANLGHTIAAPDAPMHGEQREVAARGYPVISFSGAHQYFHTPADMPERTVSADGLEEATRLMYDVADALTHTA